MVSGPKSSFFSNNRILLLSHLNLEVVGLKLDSIRATIKANGGVVAGVGSLVCGGEAVDRAVDVSPKVANRDLETK